MSSKKSNNQKSKATSTKTKSGRRSSCQNQNDSKTKSNKKGKVGAPGKMIFERHPFVYKLWARGKSYRSIAKAFTKEYEEIDHSTIFVFIKEHFEEAQAFKEEFYVNIKAIPIANSVCRIEELEDTRTELKDAIHSIMDYEPRLWEELNLASLIRELRGLTEQIQDEAGDKVTKLKGEGMGGDFHQHNYFGDETINEFADKAIQARAKKGTDSRDRFKASRLSDSGNSLSDN